MEFIRLSVSDEVLRRLIPLKGKIVEGKVIGRAGDLPLLEIDDLVFPAESRVPLKPGNRVSLWVRGIAQGKLQLQLVSQEEIDEGFFRLGLKETPENKLAYRILKGMGVSFGTEEVALLGKLILKVRDPSLVFELLRAFHLRFGLSVWVLGFLLDLGDVYALKDLLIKLLFFGRSEIKSFLERIIPESGGDLSHSIKAFFEKSGMFKLGGLSELLLLGNETEDEKRLLAWILLPRLLSLPQKREDWFVYYWFPFLDRERDLSVFLLKSHRPKEEREREERYELVLELKTLGKIRVLFYLLKGKMWVTFEAEDDRTLALIRRGLSKLLSRLEVQGYDVGGISARAMPMERDLEGEGLDIRI